MGLHGLQDLLLGPGQFPPPLPPALIEQAQHVEKAGVTQAALRREVGSGVKGCLFRAKEDEKGPAALTGDHLAGGHVQHVDVRPFFPVHLHRDEVVAQTGGHTGILERLPGHDVAPVASGVAAREENGPVLRPGPLESLLGVPVHRVKGVLEKIGASFLSETVGLSSSESAPAVSSGMPGSGRWQRLRRCMAAESWKSSYCRVPVERPGP